MGRGLDSDCRLFIGGVVAGRGGVGLGISSVGGCGLLRCGCTGLLGLIEYAVILVAPSLSLL